jgi:hypothetical protein
VPARPGPHRNGQRCAVTAQPLLWMRDSDVGRGRRGVGRRGLGMMRWALRHHAAILPHHQHLGRTLGGRPGSPPRLAPPGGRITISRAPRRPVVPRGPAPRTSLHYVNTSNRSHNICNGPLTPVTSTTSVTVVVWRMLPISAPGRPRGWPP